LKKNALTHTLLSVIALHPYIEPPPAQAQSGSPRELFIEPGIQSLRKPDGTIQMYGKVVVDMRTGRTWGFPTGPIYPYPSNSVSDKPVTTHPFELGKFAFEDIDNKDIDK
jgi:hypothetical protein